jgi:20S proteasome alpha/beta subunit
MTLIVALRATDGVVMASDGQATSASGVPTKTSTEKLDVLHGKVAFGCAGDSGLRQRVRAALQEKITEADCDLPYEQLRDKLHAVVNEVQKWAEESCVRENIYDSVPLVDVLFGAYSDGEPWIYEVTSKGIDQRHDLGEAIGEGRHFAAYALVSAEHYELPARGFRKVRLLAYRAVDDAIRTDAAGLGPPVHMVQVNSEGATRLSDEEMSGLKTAVNVWQGHECDVFLKQAAELTTDGTKQQEQETGSAKTGIDAPSA